MPRDLRAYLWDIGLAADNIQLHTQGKQLSEYEHDALLRAAVERWFETIGEALAQATRLFPDLSTRLPGAKQIIAFRNRLIHGYAAELLHSLEPK